MTHPRPRCWFTLLLAGCLASSLYAQEQTSLPRLDDAPIRFDHLTNAHGLSQRTVYSIVQDRQGFMWFTTQNGLNRYDGYRFTIYEHEPDNPTSMGGTGWIYAIYEDREGRLWIGNGDRNNPIDRFDPATETFTRYPHDPDDPATPSAGRVLDIVEDHEGIVWFAGWGLNRYDPETETFTHLLPDPNHPDNAPSAEPANWGNWINVIREDRHGMLWVGTRSGLFRYDRATGVFTRFKHDPDDPMSLSDDLVNTVYEDRKGALWVGTALGLNRYDRERGTFERFYPDSRYGTSSTNAAAGQVNTISSLLEDQTGAFWVGTGTDRGGGGGLFRFDRRAGLFTPYRHIDSDPYSLAHNVVHALYEDRQGVLWIGTNSGVDRTDRATRLVTLYQPDPEGPESHQGGYIFAIHFARDGALWSGTSTGLLSRYDRTTGTYTHYWHDPDDATSLGPGDIREIFEDSQGRIWVGHNGGGVSRFDAPPDLGHAPTRLRHFRHGPNDERSLSGDRIWEIFEDSEGTIWLGALGAGLNRYEPETETFRRIKSAPADSLLISRMSIDAFYENMEGDLWLNSCNMGGPIKFDRETETFEHYPVGCLGGWSFYERAQEPGVFWVGKARPPGGLSRFDSRTGQVTTYTPKNSTMPDHTVYCVLGDGLGHLWVSTNRGLARLNPDTGEFMVLGLEDGLQDLEYDGGGCHQRDTGELFFGGVKGINAIRPGDAFNNLHPPQVTLTTLRLGREVVTPDRAGPLKQRLAETAELTLKHWQNDVTLEYVGLHFRHPEKNQYQYMLEGYDETWSEETLVRQATYTNLPSGDYIFHVTASNSDGVWSEEEASLAITILPPWWRTAWAYMLYGLLFAAGVFAVDRFQRRRLIRRERERTMQRELAQKREIERAHTELQQTHTHLKATQAQLIQQEKMASLGQLTAGIAHEIKNPLNFVNNFAEVSEELANELHEDLAQHPEALAAVEDLLADLKQNAQVINQHGKRADSIVHAMMQHASGGTGQREPTDLNALVSEHIDLAYHGKRAQVSDLKVEIERNLGTDAGAVEIVPQEIGRVLLNLLGNAFDAVHEHTVAAGGEYTPTVSVSTRRVDGQVEIRVSDNGPGIPSEMREKIFEPFFTTKPTGTGTGLGLSLSYDIVTQGHGGRLTVKSEEGKGATFIVTLPVHHEEADSSA